jgi:plastocyanin
MSALRVAVLAVVVVLAGGLGGFPFHHSQSPQPNSDPNEVTASITVTATADYGYQPDTFQQIPVDANISVTFSDMDVLPHSFTISSREGFVIPTTDTPTQLSALFTAYPAIYSVLLGGMGDQYVGTFQSPAAPGWYEFVCNVSGHFQDGMYGFIAFGESLPSNLTPPTRTGLGGASITPLQAGIVGVVVVVVILGMIYWITRRAPPRYPSSTAPPPRPVSSTTVQGSHEVEHP